MGIWDDWNNINKCNQAGDPMELSIRNGEDLIILTKELNK
jgi:hypothetical protein